MCNILNILRYFEYYKTIYGSKTTCQNQILSNKYPLMIRIGKKQPVNWMTWWYAHEQYVDGAYILFLFLDPDRTKWIFRKYKMALISIISTVVLIYSNITWLLFVTYRFAFWKISNHFFSRINSQSPLRMITNSRFSWFYISPNF